MTRQEMFEVVKANIHEIIENARGREILETQSMAEFQADSLEIVEVVARSMKQLKLKIHRTELSKAQSIAGLLDLFENAARAAEQTDGK